MGFEPGCRRVVGAPLKLTTEASAPINVFSLITPAREPKQLQALYKLYVALIVATLALKRTTQIACHRSQQAAPIALALLVET